MSKYGYLVNILDKIREEAPQKYTTKYNRAEVDIEKINQARARAFIHLLLKARFGILSFEERERCISDGGYDGGVDGYHIDTQNRIIFFIQSKFRTNEKNFESKEITLEEILAMDIGRIIDGEKTDEDGNEYNGKIKQLQREISSLEGVSRYSYRVLLLANLENFSQSKLQQLSDGYSVEVISHSECYSKLVFPILSGTFFNAADLHINIDLSNKNAGSKISYSVMTRHGECEITALFVPTLEIAKALSRYKNSILKYNPRSYLELEGQKVNRAIRETILNKSTNEFALFNNGITMISDETFLNERIGQKNKAQLSIKNPQIINGGQTAYTLSNIYSESSEKDPNEIFQGKEVLLKVITLNEEGGTNGNNSKLSLIDEISTATNQQTPVLGSDRLSNDHIHMEIQRAVYEEIGILYERKRGEFEDGISNGYVSKEKVVERNLFFRVLFASIGKIEKAHHRKLFLSFTSAEQSISTQDIHCFYFGYLLYLELSPTKRNLKTRDRELFGKIYAFVLRYKPEDLRDYREVATSGFSGFHQEWENFVQDIAKDSRHVQSFRDKETGDIHKAFSKGKWARSPDFIVDIRRVFGAAGPEN